MHRDGLRHVESEPAQLLQRGRSWGESCRLAGAITTPSGMPFAVDEHGALGALFSSVPGDFPAASPPQRALTMHPRAARPDAFPDACFPFLGACFPVS